MKKVLTMLLLAAVVFSTVGCCPPSKKKKGDEKEKAEQKEETAPKKEESLASLHDKSHTEFKDILERMVTVIEDMKTVQDQQAKEIKKLKDAQGTKGWSRGFRD